jgi:hypothetical protein
VVRGGGRLVRADTGTQRVAPDLHRARPPRVHVVGIAIPVPGDDVRVTRVVEDDRLDAGQERRVMPSPGIDAPSGAEMTPR